MPPNLGIEDISKDQGMTGLSASEDRTATTSSWVKELAALAFCCTIGVLLATLPHLIWWPRLGEPVWIADYDDLGVYLALGGHAYQNHPWTHDDPVLAEGGTSPYPWLQMGPGVLVARLLGLGPLGLDLVWRAWAGLSIAAAWYLLLRQYVRRPEVAAALTAFLLGDIGLVTAQPLYKQALVSARILAGRPGGLLASYPQIHLQWRIVTPGLSLAYLLVSACLLGRAVARPSRGRIVAAGLGFGLLFYVYVYFWTAVGLGLVLALALDAGRRRVHLLVGAIGGLVGLPQVVAIYALKKTFSPDFLPRIDFLPIGRFDELLIPRAGLLLLGVGLIWVRARRRELIYLWCLAAAGLALMNHQVLSGLQLQNHHWLYAGGPLLTELIVLLGYGELARVDRPRPVVWGLVALGVLHLAAAFWLRAVEATRTEQSLEILEHYRRYRAQRLGPGIERLRPRGVVAGEMGFVSLALVLENQRPLDHYAVLNSPAVGDDEWDARIALNRYLLGADRTRFEAEQREWLRTNPWGLWAPHRASPAQQQDRLARRLRAFATVEADPRAALERFDVRYVALPVDRTPPAIPGTTWRCLQTGPSWSLWERPDGRGTDRRYGSRSTSELIRRRRPISRIKPTTSEAATGVASPPAAARASSVIIPRKWVRTAETNRSIPPWASSPWGQTSTKRGTLADQRAAPDSITALSKPCVSLQTRATAPGGTPSSAARSSRVIASTSTR
jgi:hypothetical protein